jgi:hypothetical protein
MILSNNSTSKERERQMITKEQFHTMVISANSSTGVIMTESQGTIDGPDCFESIMVDMINTHFNASKLSEDKMAKDKITEEFFDFETGKSYELGIASGLAVAYKILMDKAVEYFGRNQDDKAKDVRALAGLLFAESDAKGKIARAKTFEGSAKC